MSRSIGDTIGADIGVIATPVTSSYDHVWGNDYFIVAGSDGIWDVMENQEVIRFIESYRRNSKCNFKSPVLGGQKVTPGNSGIAQLL